MRLAALILRLVYLLRERRSRESRDSNYSPSRDTSFPREFFNKSFCKANRLITRRTFTLSRASRVKSINLIAKSATRVNFFQLLTRTREHALAQGELELSISIFIGEGKTSDSVRFFDIEGDVAIGRRCRDEAARAINSIIFLVVKAIVGRDKRAFVSW